MYYTRLEGEKQEVVIWNLKFNPIREGFSDASIDKFRAREISQ